MADDTGESPTRTTRSSTRVRNKSARALESEHTDRLLAAARDKRATDREAKEEAKEEAKGEANESASKEDEGHVEAQEEQETAAGPGPSTTTAPKGKTRARAPPKRKTKKTNDHCVCKEDREGSMIECGTCNDWFHFDCVDMTEEEAERIHKYVCQACAERTGEKTTYLYDIEGYPSPAPPDDVEVKAAEPPAKRRKSGGKTTKRKKAKTAKKSKKQEDDETKEEAEDDVEEDDKNDADHAPEDASEASSDSDEGSDAEEPPSEAESVYSDAAGSRKRPRRTTRQASPRKRASIDTSRKLSASGPSSAVPATAAASATTSDALPPARQYVLDKMAATVRSIFGEDKMDADAAATYGGEVEATIFSHFKEFVKGKEHAGGRYKAQFNLLHSSLIKTLRPELRDSIVDGTITPAKMALLTSLELATAEQLATLEAAKQEALRQTVRVREDEGGVRIGRDGFESVKEGLHETEMSELARQEAKARRRESEAGVDEDPEVVRRPSAAESKEDSGKDVIASPHPPKTPLPPARKVSVATLPSPSARPGISSAWGGENAKSPAEDELEISGDQDAIDLSDIVPEEIDYNDGLDDSNPEWDAFTAKPVLWSGGMSNPAVESLSTAPVQLRQLAGRTTPPANFWKHLLPHTQISITGRVHTWKSLQYLADRRLDRTRELVVVSFTVDPSATSEQKAAWATNVNFHIGRGRHGLYHPYGDRPPPGAARELYLIPLEPDTEVPDLFGLIDNFSVPAKRTEPLMIGVFLVGRDTPTSTARSPADGAAARPPPPPHAYAGPPGLRPPAHGPPGPPGPPRPVLQHAAPVGPGPGRPVLPPNLNIQQLMANLDPAAIAAAAARAAAAQRPPTHGPPGGPGGPGAPGAPPPRPGYPPQQAPQHQEAGYYPPPPPGYAAGPSSAPPQAPSWGQPHPHQGPPPQAPTGPRGWHAGAPSGPTGRGGPPARGAGAWRGRP